MIEVGADAFMLASKGDVPTRPGWIYEFKYDGYRALAIKTLGGVRFMSRNGKDATDWWPEIRTALAALPGEFVIDSEVCVLDSGGIPDFEAMRRAVASRRKDGFTLYAFDLLFASGRDLRALPLLDRKKRLEKLIRCRSSINYVSHIAGSGKETFDFAVSIGMEGVVSKRADSPYTAGRGTSWIKTKPFGVHDGWNRPLARARAASGTAAR